MTGRIVVAILVGAILCSGSSGQAVLGMDWLRDLSENIDALNRNIQQNVQQINQRVQQTVQSNLMQAHRLTETVNQEIASGNVQQARGNNVVITNNDGTKIVHSGRTSDGKPFVRESSDKIVGDTLRHVERIYDPTTNASKVYGYTWDLKDPNAKPVPINDNA